MKTTQKNKEINITMDNIRVYLYYTLHCIDYKKEIPRKELENIIADLEYKLYGYGYYHSKLTKKKYKGTNTLIVDEN